MNLDAERDRLLALAEVDCIDPDDISALCDNFRDFAALCRAQAAEIERLRAGVNRWLEQYTPTDDFGCACTPRRTCGTCQWRERTDELRAAIAAERKVQP